MQAGPPHAVDPMNADGTNPRRARAADRPQRVAQGAPGGLSTVRDVEYCPAVFRGAPWPSNDCYPQMRPVS